MLRFILLFFYLFTSSEGWGLIFDFLKLNFLKLMLKCVRLTLKLIRSLRALLFAAVLFAFSCTQKDKALGAKEENKIARFLGDYVTPNYFKRLEGYDWMAYTISAHTPDTLKIEVRSRVDIKKPTCGFSGLATRLNDSTLTYETKEHRADTLVKVLLTLSKDTLLEVSASHPSVLKYYCSGGGSLAGAYVKLKQPLDSFQLTRLTLKEDALGSLKLKKGMMVVEDSLKKYFPLPYEVIRKIGKQDGLNFIYYELNYNGKTLATINTEDTESLKLTHVLLKKGGFAHDQYGMQAGYAVGYLKSKRPGLKIQVGYHFHIYLYEKDSHIAYEVTRPDYDGPDKASYTWEELEGAHIRFIVWQ